MFRNFIALIAAVFALNAFAAVDVNQASRAELESVKGIGPGLSSKITEARQTGSFKDWADLVQRVGGIGPGNAARFSKAGLTVEGAAFDAAALPPATGKTADKSAAGDGRIKATKAPRKVKAGEAAPG